MKITLNGKEHSLDQTITITDLLASLGLVDKPAVVELNKQALFPREYSEVTLSENDSVEIIAISAGG